MKRFAVAALLALSGIACVSKPVVPAGAASTARLPRHIRVQLTGQGDTVIREVPLEEYVRATAITEVAPAAADVAAVERMLEVQTIISRTYAVSHLARHAREGFDLCSTTHCQLFEPRRLSTSRWAGAAATAVTRTAGIVLVFDRKPVQALFHADCGGHTSTSSAVWGGVDRPYLVARPDGGAAREAHAAWQYDVSVEALTAALAADERTRLIGTISSVEVLSRDGAGRAEQVGLESRAPSAERDRRVVRGDALRQAMTRTFGLRAIRSTRFDVHLRGGTFTFAGRGFGHGVGLCQAGAFARLSAGATPNDVLRFYYPGAVIVRALGSDRITKS